jgi:hypothetical protein
VGQTLVELNMAGQLFYHVFHHSSFASHAPFGSRKAFFQHLLGHARRRQQPLTSMELMYKSAVFSWSMKFGHDGVCTQEPWNQTWRVYARRFSPVQSEMSRFALLNMTFRGQRHLAFDFFESHGSTADCMAQVLGEVEMTSEKPFFNGAWMLGCGKNAHIRKALMTHVDWGGRRRLTVVVLCRAVVHPEVFQGVRMGHFPRGRAPKLRPYA